MYFFKKNFNIQSQFSASSDAAQNALKTFASQSIGSSIINVFFTSLFTTLWDMLAKHIAEKISTSKNIQDSRNVLNKSEHSLRTRDSDLLLPQDLKLSCDNMERQIDNMLSMLYGGHTITKVASGLFLGPPGLGKTSLFKHLLDYTEKTALKFSKQKIEYSLSKTERSRIQKARKLAKLKQLVKVKFFPGAFFLQYGDAKLKIFEDFKDQVTADLKKGHLVFICIDEIDGLLYAGKDKRHSLGNLFIFGIDELKNGIKSGKYGGNLILLGTSNNPDLDYGMSRRVGEEIIVFNYPDSLNQFYVFESKFQNLLKKIKKGRYSKEELNKISFNIKTINKEVLEDIKMFNQNGIDFSGSEFENIVNNFCIFLIKSNSKDLENFGITTEEKVKNILKYFFLKEALKIMKIRQHLSSVKIQEILNILYNKIKINKKIPPIEAGTDWKNS